MSFALETLDETIRARLAAGAPDSYTARLAAQGIEKCAQKLGEEAVEAVIAAVARDRAGLTGEAADVLYHLLVVLAVSDLPFADVLGELQRRTAQSGLQEKASRTAGSGT